MSKHPNIKLLVATHKKYPMPDDKTLYFPVQVGCDEVEERLGYLCDNTGDNISYKHRWYSDISSLYWGWKNLDYDYLGNLQYRRYFVSNKKKKSTSKQHEYVLSRDELEILLKKCPVIVSKKRHYYIETNEQQYIHAHNRMDLELTKDVIRDICPEYFPKFEEVLNRTWLHINNAFIMDKEHIDQFCTWLFAILFEMEKRTDFDKYDVYQGRVLGYMSERLLDVWLEYNNVEYQEVKYALLEKENWLKKGFNFLKRKFIKSSRPF